MGNIKLISHKTETRGWTTGKESSENRGEARGKPRFVQEPIIR